MNCKAEFSRSYIPRLALVEEDKLKEIDRQEEESLKKTLKEMEENHQAWESRKVMRRAEDIRLDLMKTGKHGKRSAGTRNQEPGLRRAKKLKYSLMEDDWGEPGTSNTKKKDFEDRGDEEAYPTETETGSQKETPVEVNQEQCSSDFIPHPSTLPANQDSLQESCVTDVLDEDVILLVPRIGTITAPECQEPRASNAEQEECQRELRSITFGTLLVDVGGGSDHIEAPNSTVEDTTLGDAPSSTEDIDQQHQDIVVPPQYTQPSSGILENQNQYKVLEKTTFREEVQLEHGGAITGDQECYEFPERSIQGVDTRVDTRRHSHSDKLPPPHTQLDWKKMMNVRKTVQQKTVKTTPSKKSTLVKKLEDKKNSRNPKTASIFDFWNTKNNEEISNRRSKSVGNLENIEKTDIKPMTTSTNMDNDVCEDVTMEYEDMEDKKCIFDAKMICEKHGCEAKKVKIKVSRWRYNKKKKEFGFVKVTETKLQCTGRRKTVLVVPEISTTVQVYADRAGSDGDNTWVENVGRERRDWLDCGNVAGDQTLIGGGEQ